MRAVLWDMDDTLLETLPGRMKSLAHAYETCLGQRTDPRALWVSHRGGTLEEMGVRLLGDDWRRFVAAFRDHYYGNPRDIRPYPGIESTLESIAADGIPMAVVTSKVSWGAVEELAQGGILSYFAAVVGHDDTELHKPDPEPVFAALDRLMVDSPAGTVFVGDSPADVWAARNAGCVAVAALWGTLDEELLRDAAPDHVAALPHEVLAVRLNGGKEAGPWK
ncbi:MAG: HAD family hydrolase [Chloroflexi bacterium]|nr:HAD family hydrolase [Chloroflexota bacterium]